VITPALRALTLFLAISVVPLNAQSANPLSAGAKHTYELIRGHVTKAAAKVPEDLYAFRPTPEVRTFGQLIGHLADANFALCGVASGQKPPGGGIEKSKTSKAELTKALAEAFAFCDQVHGGMTDSAGSVLVKFMAGAADMRRPEEMPKLSVLEYNTHHTFEHYGNIVTYMRLKGLVPPSSERPSA
jgi:uncharacterized damage-inducible protein DinB